MNTPGCDFPLPLVDLFSNRETGFGFSLPHTQDDFNTKPKD